MLLCVCVWICCTWPQNKREGKFISVLKKSAKRTMNFEELDAFQWTSLAETKRQQRKKKKKGSSRARLSRRLAVCITMEKTFAWGRLFLFLCSPCVSMRYQMWTTSSLSLLAATIPSHRWNSVNFLSTGPREKKRKDYGCCLVPWSTYELQVRDHPVYISNQVNHYANSRPRRPTGPPVSWHPINTSKQRAPAAVAAHLSTFYTYFTLLIHSLPTHKFYCPRVFYYSVSTCFPFESFFCPTSEINKI